MKNFLEIGDKVKLLVDKTANTPLGKIVCKKGQIVRVCHIGQDFISIEVETNDGYEDTIEFALNEVELVEKFNK